MAPTSAEPLHFPALGRPLDPDPWDAEDPCALALGLRNLLVLAAVATLGVCWWIA